MIPPPHTLLAERTLDFYITGVHHEHVLMRVYPLVRVPS